MTAQHVAVVIRKSRRDEQAVSLDRQEKVGRRLAEHWWPGVPVVVYGDDGVSGARMDRDGWQRFAGAVRAGQVAGVATLAQARLTRAGSATWDEVAVMLHRAGIDQIVTDQNGVISVVPGNRMMGRFMAVLDQEERERAQIRITDAHANLAAEGRYSGGRIFGYRRAEVDGRSTIEPVPELATEIRAMADKVLAGHSVTSIARDLTARGVPTARGGTWAATTVRSALTKPTIAGLRAHHGEIVGAGRWEPILDRETWEAVCAVLRSPGAVLGADGKRHRVPRVRRQSRRWLLTSGISVCGLCGKGLSGQPRPKGPPIYQCHPCNGGCGRVAINAEPFEAYVEAAIRTAFANPQMVEAMAPSDTDFVAAQVELHRLETKLADLAARYAEDAITPAEWSAARAPLVARLETVGAAVEALGANLVAMPDLDEVVNHWDELTIPQKQRVIRRAVRQIVLRKADRSAPRKVDPERRVGIVWRF